jgi:hypothetical protein
MRLWSYQDYTEEELQRACMLRAMEWMVWPAFVSQPLLPVLYIFYPVYWVLVAVFIAGLLWMPFRYRLASLPLATLGCYWVRLKWATIPVGVVVLLYQARYIAAVVALATPLLAGTLNLPGKGGIVEEKVLVFVEVSLTGRRYECPSIQMPQQQRTEPRSHQPWLFTPRSSGGVSWREKTAFQRFSLRSMLSYFPMAAAVLLPPCLGKEVFSQTKRQAFRGSRL